MALKANVSFTFRRYSVEDSGIRFYFTCADPGAGEVSDYDVFVTDAELAAASTNPQRLALITTKLQRRWRANGIASVLDPLLGQSISL